MGKENKVIEERNMNVAALSLSIYIYMLNGTGMKRLRFSVSTKDLNQHPTCPLMLVDTLSCSLSILALAI